MKGEIDRSTVIIRDFNTPLPSMDRSSKQKMNKEIVALNGTLDQNNLIDIYRTFYPKIGEYAFFLNTQETFSRIDYVLGHKMS